MGLRSPATSSHPHVCFVAPAAWPILSGDTTVKFAGGAEVQQVFLARELARRGYRVSMVCRDWERNGNVDPVLVDDIEVHRCDARTGQIPILRFFHPSLTGIWTTLHRVNADVYYQRAAGAVTGVVGLFARSYGRRFVYAAACDMDLARDQTWRLFQQRGGWRSRQLYTLGVRIADAVVCQHPGQVRDCQRWFGRKGTLVPSCYSGTPGARANRDGVVLWVGSLGAGKRPEVFLDVAERLPDWRFRMVGGPSSDAAGGARFEAVAARARRLRNVEFAGFVPYAEIDAHFDAARLFVNTSEYEGFPNTFLQAWWRGIPVVSTCDPGSAIDGQPVVFRARDADEMSVAVRQLMSVDEAWRQAGERSRRYAVAAHTPEAAGAAYNAIFEELLGREMGVPADHNISTRGVVRPSGVVE